MIEVIISIIKITVFQIVGIFGLFFLFGYILSALQESTHRVYRTVFGWRGILWTAWIGTPVHELGHVIFAKLFGHKIEKIQLFKPNKRTGGLGQVNHSYNNRNIYHQIGHFFIGSAPLIFGSLAIYLLAMLLLPNVHALLSTLTLNSINEITKIHLGIFDFFQKLFSLQYRNSYAFYIFLYLSFAITSHMAPSAEDRYGMYLGLAWIIALMFLLNTLFMLIHMDTTVYLLRSATFLGILLSLLIFSTCLSLIHTIIVHILFYPLKK